MISIRLCLLNPGLNGLTIGLCTLALVMAQAATPEKAVGEDLKPVSTQITLEQARQTALTENLELKTAHKRLQVATARLTGIAFLSNLELETEFLPGDEGETSVELTKGFQLGGQRGHRKRMAKTNIEKVNAQIVNAERLLIREVKNAFYELLLIQEKIELTKTILQLDEQILEIATFKFEAGETPITEVNLAKIELQGAVREQTELKNERELAELELNSLMGMPMETSLVAMGELKYQPLKLNLDVLKAYAPANRADLKTLQLEEQITQSELALAKAENIPEIGVSLITRRESNETLFGGKISIPLPFFDRNKVEIGATKAQQQVNRAEISVQERLVTREVVGAYLAVNSAQKVLGFYEGGILDLLDENLELTRMAYELGEAELLGVILTQNEFIETRFAYLDALATYTKTLAELEAAVGGNLENIPLARVLLKSPPLIKGGMFVGLEKSNERTNQPQPAIVNPQPRNEER